MNPPGPIRVLMVEDHMAVRQGLRLLLEAEGIQVPRDAGTLASARAALAEDVPDLVMIDLSLGEESGLDLVEHVAREYPGLPTLVYSMFEEAERIQGALQAGAMGYVTKREVAEVLVQGVRECAQGNRFLSPRAARALAEAGPGSHPLSQKEQEVFSLLGQGETRAGIADRLGVSPRTIESYYARIMIKLDLESMVELRRKAVQGRR